MCIIRFLKLPMPNLVRSPPQLANTSRLMKSSNLITSGVVEFSSSNCYRSSCLNLIFLVRPYSTNASTDNTCSPAAV